MSNALAEPARAGAAIQPAPAPGPPPPSIEGFKFGGWMTVVTSICYCACSGLELLMTGDTERRGSLRAGALRPCAPPPASASPLQRLSPSAAAGAAGLWAAGGADHGGDVFHQLGAAVPQLHHAHRLQVLQGIHPPHAAAGGLGAATVPIRVRPVRPVRGQVVPTMILGSLVQGRRYSLPEYAAAALLVAGISLFTLGDVAARRGPRDDPLFRPRAPSTPSPSAADRLRALRRRSSRPRPGTEPRTRCRR